MTLRAEDLGQTTTLQTFLIADVRGYTAFTREHGDAQAALLATKFAELARDSVEARRGRVIELRGDEALAVFESTAQAIRAAVEFQVACVEETAADPSLPLTVGIGIDVGDAVPVDGGFRGAALNTAARLCSKAAAGQVLVTREVQEQAGDVGDIGFEERGPTEFKGFADAVVVIEAMVPLTKELRLPASGNAAFAEAPTQLPPELDPITALVGREHEMHWLRGTWRQARRGNGRVVFVSGPSQMGKTRLAAELASHALGHGGRVLYTGAGGAGAALAISAIRDATRADEPTLLVLDDLDFAGEQTVQVLADALEELSGRPVLTLGLIAHPDAGPRLAQSIEEADRRGDGHVSLTSLGPEGVAGIAGLYVGGDVGDVPLESMARASEGIPGRIHEVVGAWARDEAARRLAAAGEWLAKGRGRRSADLEFANNIIGLKLGRLYSTDFETAVETECPYKGLASFDEADAPYFFGRERLVGELAARSVQVGVLAVVGASGSGKSSAVAAGLLPSLRAGLLPGSERGRSVVFRPGEHPVAELAASVAPGSPTSDALEEAIAAVGSDGRLVVAVDQFEEVFTLCAEEEERNAFIEMITRAARRPNQILFVLVIRDDFYGRCAPYRELAQLLGANHVLVPPMTNDELRRAIELPARRTRLRVESELVEALVAEAAEEPGALPLLSAALVELWHAREDGWLRMDAHERTGGIRGAVARLAEASFRQLSAAQQDSARRIFVRLAGIGEDGVVTRRRVHTSEFDIDADPVAAEVLERVTQDRLLRASDSTVEVAHEALLREWPRLSAWLEEDVHGHRLRQHLTQSAQQWVAAQRDPSEVYRGARLSAALDWASTHTSDLNEIEREFLAAGRDASEREAEKQRRTNRRLRGLLAGTAVFLIAALIAGALALVQSDRAGEEAGRAENEARIARARELASAAVVNLDVDPERSTLLALEAIDVTLKAGGSVVPEAEEALHRALRRSRIVLAVPQGGGLAVTPDGKRFATTGQDGSTRIWKTATGERVLTVRGHDGDVTGASFSPDGRTLVTTGTDGTVRVRDAETGREIHALRGHRATVLGAAFSSDGRLLATKGNDASVRIWNVATGRQVVALRGPPGAPFDSLVAAPAAPAFSLDSERVASGGWGTDATIWDVETGEIVMTLPGHTWPVSGIAFSPDGSRIATATYEGIARTWDARTGRQLTTFSGHAGELYSVAYSSDGSRIATAGSDATARIWDAATGEHLITLAGHKASIRHVAFTPDGERLLTTAFDGTTRIWDVTVSGGRDWLTVTGPALRMGGVAFSPDSSMVAVPNQGAGVTIWDSDTGAKRMRLGGHRAIIARVAFSPDGTLLAGTDGTGVNPDEANWEIPIWDVMTGELVQTLVGHEGDVPVSAFSPDGSRLATGSYDGTLRIWDVATGTERRRLDVGADAFGLGFSPDDRYLLAGIGVEGTVRVWNTETLEERAPLTGHTDFIQALSFGPDGSVATASGDGTARIWDIASGSELATLRGHSGAVLGVAFSPDGDKVATGGDDGTAKLWDAATGRELLTLFGHDRIVHTVAFSPDGRLLATASGDGTVAMHILPIEELRRLAQDRVTRGLTDEECRQYLHRDRC